MHGFETDGTHSLGWELKSCCQEHFLQIIIFIILVSLPIELVCI